MPLYHAYVLCARYAMSGTEIKRYLGLCTPYAMLGTDLRIAATSYGERRHMCRYLLAPDVCYDTRCVVLA
eukprot:1757434-Rhodomonas_salina.1